LVFCCSCWDKTWDKTPLTSSPKMGESLELFDAPKVPDVRIHLPPAASLALIRRRFLAVEQCGLLVTRPLWRGLIWARQTAQNLGAGLWQWLEWGNKSYFVLRGDISVGRPFSATQPSRRERLLPHSRQSGTLGLGGRSAAALVIYLGLTCRGRPHPGTR
jgi:hypothetical protein